MERRRGCPSSVGCPSLKPRPGAPPRAPRPPRPGSGALKFGRRYAGLLAMILALIVFLAGVLTILSPCILPVLPFVFTRADRKFSTNGLPMLIGMAITFAGVATLAAVGGSWVVRFNQFGRTLALILLTAFAATLLSRRLADALARPFVALGNRLMHSAPSGASNLGPLHAALLGVATGLLWAPCAGPILGLVLTGAAISGPNPRTTLLLFTYAAGAAPSPAGALFA